MRYMLDAGSTMSLILYGVALVASYVVLHNRPQTIEMQKCLVSPDLQLTNQSLIEVLSM